mgnify:CR=1 FL=1
MPEEFSSGRARSFPELIERNPSFIKRNINEPLDNFVGVFRNRYNDSYSSGLFELPLPEPVGPVLGVGTPDYRNKSFQFYESTLRDFSFSLPHSAKWVVFIKPQNHQFLMSQVRDIKTFEPSNNDTDWNFKYKSDRLMDTDAQETIGCIFALGVSQAGHTLSTANFGGSGGSNNGFIKAPSTQGRADNSTIEFIVKETNSSYTDFVLRPWSLVASHLGFHARPKGQSIKADITIFEMDHTHARELPMIRKVFNYYDCIPIDINTENLNYEPDKIIQRQIQFSYNYYTIQAGDNYLSDNVDDSEPQPVPRIIIPEQNSK